MLILSGKNIKTTKLIANYYMKIKYWLKYMAFLSTHQLQLTAKFIEVIFPDKISLEQYAQALLESQSLKSVILNLMSKPSSDMQSKLSFNHATAINFG